ncbi:MAG: hypothetical protein M1831_007531 [Alyxoria varia]|nr:MAG: hypothetical protein M1831_007531 [Alyxoria varia]
MGIRGLKGKLEPYKTPVQWTRSSPSNANEDAPTGVVIDGPAFAHWIFNQCCAQKDQSEGPLKALPSYPEISRQALAWLRDLRSVGLHIKHVFFDGALPESKLKIRYERLQQSLDRLRSFRLNNPVLEADPWAQRRSFSTARPKSKGQAPTPSFLVSVVLDCLFGSEFGDRVRVVLCEADLMCTSPDYCTENDIILTGDSDFVVHNPRGRIVFFEDMDFVRNAKNDLVMIRSSCLQSLDFAKRIGVSDLSKWAYFMTIDSRTNVKHAADQAKSDVLSAAQEKEVEKIRATYESSELEATLASEHLNQQAIQVLQRMDPRLSETVYCALTSSSTGEETRFYQVPLFEDTKRASSWQPSQDVRQLAFGLIGLATGCNSDIQEVERKGDRFNVVHVQVPGVHEVEKGLRAQEQRLQESINRLPSYDPISRWRIMALLHVYQWDVEISSNLHGKCHILKTKDRAITWFDVHLSAQTEGVLYSYRILRQALEFFLACEGKEGHGDASRLLTTLQSLPHLDEVIPAPGASLDIGECQWLLKELYGDYINGREVSLEGESAKEAAASKGYASQSDRKKQKSKTNASPSAKNFYAILQDED